MRKAAEAPDDPVVVLGPAVVVGPLHPRLEQFHLPVLIRPVLRMLQRQIVEPADVARDLQIVPRLQGPPREHPRQRIGGEGVRRAAETVPRKLVQQDQQRQRPLGRPGPVVQLAPGGGDMGVMEAPAEFGVEGVVPGEPLFRPRLFPEGDDGGRRYVCAHDR